MAEISNPVFAVVVLTAAPPGLSQESGGAYLKIDGREALLRSVELFLNRDNVKQILLVVQSDAADEARRKFGPHLSFSGVKLITGGPRWSEQIATAAAALAPEPTHVLLHDAARPAVPFSDIDAVMAAVEKHPAVALATPVRTTLVQTDEGGSPMAFQLPQDWMHLLTPQAFSRQKFEELAKSKTEIHPSQLTLVKGSALNMRLGTPGDAGLVKTMINQLPKAKVRPPSSPFEEAQW